MGNNIPLHEYIGKIAQAIPAQTHATDFTYASDGSNDIPLLGHQGVLLIADWTPVAGATATVSVNYASDGIDSNALAGSDYNGGSNAVFGAFNSDDTAGVYLMNIPTALLGLKDGTLFVKAEIVGAPKLGVVGIPYGGNMVLPSTNANTIVNVSS